MFKRIVILACPGINGIWQVLGRADIGYGQRVCKDEVYIPSWSTWQVIYYMLALCW
jgi:lipopolysaccharide/colanic/teichoic acid biosynthesis glycosyltransferase